MFEKKLVNLIILCLSSIFAFFFDGKCFASTTISEDKSGYQKQSPPDKEKDNNIKKSEEEKKSQEEEKTAETHFMRGVDFFQDGMISAALAEFLMSYKKAPKWEVLYNIGICYYRLGRYDEALKTLEKYIKDGAENIPEERKSVVEKLRIKMGSSYGSIAFTGKKKNVQIVIDSKYKVVTPVNKPIEIPAGLHTLNIFLEGYYPVIKEISVAAGQTTTVPIELEPSPPIKELIEKKKILQYIEMNDRLKKLEIAGWSLIGTSALLGITSIATGVVTYQLRQDEISELFKCHTPILTRKDCPEAFKIADKREKWEWITNGLAISAAANLIAGASILIARKIKIKKISDSFKKGSKIGMLDIRGILVQW